LGHTSVCDRLFSAAQSWALGSALMAVGLVILGARITTRSLPVIGPGGLRKGFSAVMLVSTLVLFCVQIMNSVGIVFEQSFGAYLLGVVSMLFFASLMFLRARSLQGEYGGTMTAGSVEDFPAGSVTEFEDGNFFLVRSSDGGFLAIYRRCPHLGCTVKWVEDQERFYCPCHASSFDKHGDFINQPVPRALDSFTVQIEENQVQVDTSKLIQREYFSPEELVYG